MMHTTTTASAPAAQPVNPAVNQAAVVEAALRVIDAAYDSSASGRWGFLHFAQAIKGNREAKQQLEELLHTLGSGPKDDARLAFGLGVVAGQMYAQSIAEDATPGAPQAV